MLDDNWFNENVYAKFGQVYKSAAASNLLIRAIWTMRQGQDKDVQKWWARRIFAEYLPYELTQFAYKADNAGNFINGIWRELDDIRMVFRTAYDITKRHEFTDTSLDALIMNVHDIDERQDKLILARVSFANWIYGLVRENLI